jgi:FixJ family two-component response regulator
MARSSVKGKVRGGVHSSCILLIADILKTSEKTVNVHRLQVMQKMQVHWVAHRVRLVEKLGLTVP